MYAFAGRCDQRLSIEDSAYKIRQNPNMLRAVPPDGNPDVPGRRHREPARIRSRKITHRHLIPNKEEFVIFDHDFASFGGYFEAICTRRFPGGSADYSRHPVGILQVGSNVVFNFDIVIPAKLTKCPDSGRHSKDPLVQIQIVRALIEQNTPSLTRPRRPPGT